MEQTNGSVNSKGVPPDIEHFPLRRLEMAPGVVSSFLLKAHHSAQCVQMSHHGEQGMINSS